MVILVVRQGDLPRKIGKNKSIRAGLLSFNEGGKQGRNLIWIGFGCFGYEAKFASSDEVLHVCTQLKNQKPPIKFIICSSD